MPELSGFLIYVFRPVYSDFKMLVRLTHGDKGPRSQMEGLQNGLVITRITWSPPGLVFKTGFVADLFYYRQNLTNTVQVCNKYNIRPTWCFQYPPCIWPRGRICPRPSASRKYWAPQPNTRADTETPGNIVYILPASNKRTQIYTHL